MNIAEDPKSQMHPKKLSLFLNHLDTSNKLAQTVLYSINAADNDMLATMAGNFNDGSYPGKIQSGAAWWFNDQKDGITAHLNSVSNMGLLSRFIGMLTDSRSFLSFPRHEYFRRILCNVLGSHLAPIDISAGDILHLAVYNFDKDNPNYRIVFFGSAQLTIDTSISQARASQTFSGKA